MATVLGTEGVRVPKPRTKFGWTARAFILSVAFVYLMAPLYAGAKFSLQDNNGAFSWSSVTTIPQQPGFLAAFSLSSRLAVVTVLGVLLLIVPTLIFIHLRVPQLITTVEIVSLLPIIFPPIVLILGFMHEAPGALIIWPYHLAPLYVVFTLPFVVRALNAGLSGLDLTTLVEASRSLGANFVLTLWRVILPNLTTALVSSMALVVAFVYSEFTMAQFQQRPTLPVWIAQFAMSSGHISTAAAMLSLLGAWALLALVLLTDLGRSRWRTRRSA